MQEKEMNIHVTIIADGSEEAPLNPEKARAKKLTVKAGTLLYSLLKDILPLGQKGKIIVVNGNYVKTNYDLKDGDVIRIFPSLAGG
jgi:molybdopterin converting factor small subunit